MTPARNLGTACAALLLLAGGCFGSSSREARSRASGDAELSVEVFSGFGKEAPSISPAPLHVLVNITPVLGAEDVDAPEARQLALARDLTEDYFEEHRELAALGPEFHPFHRRQPHAAGQTCSELGSGDEFFASEALDRLREDLANRKQLGDARVLLFTRFENECTPRVCQAAAQLVQPGTWLEVVRVGPGSEPPACLAELRPSADSPIPFLEDWRTPNTPRFAVENYSAAAAAQSEQNEANVLSRGQAWGTPVAISPGLRQIRVELDPPALVGPIRIRPGEKLRLRLLDFPLSAPDQRTWRVEEIDAVAQK